jgi:hypothetical protein
VSFVFNILAGNVGSSGATLPVFVRIFTSSRL